MKSWPFAITTLLSSRCQEGGPAVSADRRRVAALVIREIDQDTAHAPAAHFTEVDLCSRFIEWSGHREFKHERKAKKVRPRIAPRPRARLRGTSARTRHGGDIGIVRAAVKSSLNLRHVACPAAAGAHGAVDGEAAPDHEEIVRPRMPPIRVRRKVRASGSSATVAGRQ
jgi:hypothetical protein